jgi:hypothetical protein
MWLLSSSLWNRIRTPLTGFPAQKPNSGTDCQSLSAPAAEDSTKHETPALGFAPTMLVLESDVSGAQGTVPAVETNNSKPRALVTQTRSNGGVA